MTRNVKLFEKELQWGKKFCQQWGGTEKKKIEFSHEKQKWKVKNGPATRVSHRLWVPVPRPDTRIGQRGGLGGGG